MGGRIAEAWGMGVKDVGGIPVMGVDMAPGLAMRGQRALEM